MSRAHSDQPGRRRRTALAGVGLALAALAIDLAVWGGDTSLRTGGRVSVAVVVAAALPAYAPLALSRWRPLAAFCSLWVFSLVGLVLPSFEPFVGMLSALYAVSRRSSRPVAILAGVMCLVPIGVNVVNAWTYRSDESLIGVSVVGGLWLLLYLIVWVVGRLARRSAQRAAHHETAVLAAAEEARRLERVEIGRELHDSVAHALSAIVLRSAGARVVAQRAADASPIVGDAFADVERSAAQAMRELHRMLGLMREGAAAADGTVSLAASHALDDLDQLLETTRRSGLPVQLATTGVPVALDPSVEHAAYRFVQETLANAMKHAGAGGSADLAFEWTPDHVTVRTRSHDGDDRARMPIRGGHGLVGLSERLRLLGGTMTAGPTAGGYLTEARFPTQPATTRAMHHAPQEER